MDIHELRKEIDQLDFELLKMLKARMETALKIRKCKAEDTILDPDREQEILERTSAHALALGLLSPELVQDLFSRIMTESKALQAAGHLLVGFQGEHGANSEVAARIYDPNLVYIPCMEFADVLEGVSQGHLDLGIVPLENTLGGAITLVNELLIDSDLQIIGAVNLPIHHCLLTLPGTDHREIRTVYSHPQALTQCRNFLHRNNLEAHPFYDTAGASRMLSIERPKASAAISSILCAELYNLEIIKEDIEDHRENRTRFVVIAREAKPEGGTKCSMIFSVAHKAGALFDSLRVFAENSLSMTRIESLPNRRDPGNYYFFVDIEGNIQDPIVEHALELVQENTSMYKFLGCYTEVAPQ
ncbi:prephenate dehydratase [candidate division KSB3 bacterium]|uniref:Bifunctional chorismate mutase/prephenate dehydratase n=1 Tax=candidate division KSB3 bacterium TaxID=2044937 RepID=A0A2G6E8R7_9BACT|nr:MAG: prephenate dehydratase [candidate division KSB3 bacterium]PIE30678.1 MAG: prephenate dehydratase [candidate division KSB3 bacterium]